jgi:Domain of unknown function (DUF4136)
MKTLYLIFLVVLIFRCSPEIQAYTDYDPDYDLWKYRTFDWAQKMNVEQNQNPLYYNELNDKRIKKSIRNQLEKRNYQLTATSPHLILHYHIIVEDKSVLVTEPFGYSYGPYWMKRPQQTYTYTQGTLILDLMDTRSNQLVWRGWAVAAVDQIDSPEKIDKLVDTAVRKMFIKFPYARK